jgi:uncharacterized protein YjlB
VKIKFHRSLPVKSVTKSTKERNLQQLTTSKEAQVVVDHFRQRVLNFDEFHAIAHE